MTELTLPEPGNYLESIRSSCHRVRTSANVAVKNASIDRLLQSPAFTQTYARISKSHGMTIPLNFPSPLAELNFLSVLNLLNFASGYRIPLREQTGRGAWDNIRALMFSMYISSDDDNDFLSANGMKSVSEVQIAQLMRVNIHVEKPHDTLPGITVGELGGPVYELVKIITGVLNETGSILVSSSYPSLGSFMVEALMEGKRRSALEDEGSFVEVVLQRLATAFPAFRDVGIVNGQPVYCFKKALLLLSSIKTRFGSLETPPFPIPNTSTLPVFSDNVLPSMLVHLGVVDLSHSTLASVFPDAGDLETIDRLLQSQPPIGPEDQIAPPEEGPMLTPHQAYVLRAAAIDACELIVQRAQALNPPPLPESLTLEGLNNWLWAGAKNRADYRSLPRFVLRDTVFF